MPQITEDVLRDIVDRIVHVADPSRIILFGSAASGDMGPNSDVDLLVIKDGDYDYYALLRRIYRGLRGVDHAVDVILVDSEQVEQYRDTHCLVIKPALKEGREVYRALSTGRS